jgi:hypothetical protein
MIMPTRIAPFLLHLVRIQQIFIKLGQVIENGINMLHGIFLK